MARMQKRQGAPRNLPVDEAAPGAGARCSCREPATVVYRNGWRSADACSAPECRMAAMSWAANRPYSRQARDRAPKPMMRPPQAGKLHPLLTRDLKPRAVPPGPRPLGGVPARAALRTDPNDALRLSSAGGKP
jgi:hypothetical protein